MTALLDIPEVLDHFIGGRFVSESGANAKNNKDESAFFETLNPATNESITKVARGREKEVNLAVKSSDHAFKEGPWHNMPVSERSNWLFRIAEEIEKSQEEFARLETLDTGIPIKQTRSQMKRAAENFKFFASEALSIRDAAFPVGSSFFNYAQREPIGVAGLITPWNTPMMLETWKIAPCLAAGNTCVLKPAEWAPLSANRLARLFQEVGFPQGVFNVVNGLGEEAGASLVSNPLVKLISFTGETTTGREIMRNGAATLKHFSMELGGKSPAIVFKDAELKRALDAVIFGMYSLNGERCTANSRLLVEESIYDEFISALKDRVLNIKVGDPFDEETEIGPLIHPEHFRRVTNYIKVGVEEGAKVEAGGKKPEEFLNKEGNYLEATLLTNVKNSMRIAQEEIFGPVLVAMPFQSEEESLEIANDVKYGLASYVWTADLEKAHRIASKIEAGLVWINSQNVRDLRTPFGGSKESGIGREGGEYSFDFYTQQKTVHVALGEHQIPKMGVSSKKREKKGKK